MARLGSLILAACCVGLLASAVAAERVSVFAAASLKTALDALEPAVEAATGHELRLVYAGSSTLARQIEQGAPADLFISAHADWMDTLEARDKLVAGSRVDLLSGRLVLISREAAPELRLNAPESFEGARIAMGLTRAVPAGIYGREALEALGLWAPLKAQVVETDNVRAALALVARGEARFGIVYASDALAEPRVQVVKAFEASLHSPIIYPAALVSDRAAAGEVLAYLQSAAAWRVFEAQGFLKVEPRP